MRWHGLRALRNANQNTIIFGVIAGMAILALLVLVVQRRRRRWF
jgi:LPXTG-motif cell wall-anchored protein